MLSDFNSNYPDNISDDAMDKRIRLILEKIDEIKKYHAQHDAYFSNNKKINPALLLLEEKKPGLFGRARAYQIKKIQESRIQMSTIGAFNKNNHANKWIDELHLHAEKSISGAKNFPELDIELNFFNSHLYTISQQDLKFDQFQKNPGYDIESSDISHFSITEDRFDISNLDQYIDLADTLIKKFNKFEEMLLSFNRDYPDNSHDSMPQGIRHIMDEIDKIIEYHAQHDAYFTNNKKIKRSILLLEKKKIELFGRIKNYHIDKIHQNILSFPMTGRTSENNPV